jgi:hypothetical protein
MWFALSDECLKANVWVLSARADEGGRHELQDRSRTQAAEPRHELGGPDIPRCLRMRIVSCSEQERG